MSDWKFLNQHRITQPTYRVHSCYISTEKDGFNGLFRFTLDGRMLRCLASNGSGWEHVSVTEEFSTKPVPWSVMCKIKDLFWDDDQWVVQFHPPRAEYVNYHPGCLHLWRYIGGGPFEMPTPHSRLVGPK